MGIESHSKPGWVRFILQNFEAGGLDCRQKRGHIPLYIIYYNPTGPISEPMRVWLLLCLSMLCMAMENNNFDRLGRMEEEMRAEGFAIAQNVGELNLFDQSSGLTPLMKAASDGLKDMVRSFLVAGAKADLLNSRGETALMLAVRHGHYFTVVELLKAPSCDLYQRNRQGANILHQSIAGGLDVIVHAVLYTDMDRRSNPDIRDHRSSPPIPLKDTVLEGSSPMTGLMMACMNGKKDIVKTLLSVGANVNVQTPTGETALMYASMIGRNDIVEMLLKAGAQVDLVTTEMGFTCLMLAASRGMVETVELLLVHLRNNGLESVVNLTDVAGNTALDHAANATPPEDKTMTILTEAGGTGRMFASA